MAIKRKIRVRRPNYAIILVIVLTILIALFWSCGPAPSSTEVSDAKEGKIIEGEFVHEHIDGQCIRFVRFKYNGHWYIDSEGGIMFHSPDCDCQDESSSSLLFDKPSSIFDW